MLFFVYIFGSIGSIIVIKVVLIFLLHIYTYFILINCYFRREYGHFAFLQNFDMLNGSNLVDRFYDASMTSIFQRNFAILFTKMFYTLF